MEGTIVGESVLQEGKSKYSDGGSDLPDKDVLSVRGVVGALSCQQDFSELFTKSHSGRFRSKRKMDLDSPLHEGSNPRLEPFPISPVSSCPARRVRRRRLCRRLGVYRGSCSGRLVHELRMQCTR